MSLRFLGLGTGNKVVSLNMVVLLGLRAERRATAVRTCPVPPFGVFGCDVAELGGHFGLKALDQTGGVFSGEFGEGVRVKGTEQGSDVLIRIVRPLCQSEKCPHLCRGRFAVAAMLRRRPFRW